MQKITIFIAVLWNCLLGYAQEKQIIIVTDNGTPLEGAVMHFQGRHYLADAQGNISLSGIQSGSYIIKITYVGYEDFSERIDFPLKKNPMKVEMQPAVNELTQVMISAKASAPKNKIAQVISASEIEKQSAQNLAQVLASVKGVSMVKTGATISKPVIHGMHSNRILLINNDVRQEGQQWGSDHAPEIDPQNSEKITVIKGAESVRYGADALGGVILVAPAPLPYSDGFHGSMGSGYASNGNRFFSWAKISSSLGKHHNWAWAATGSQQFSGDIKTATYYLNNTGNRQNNFSFSVGKQQDSWGTEAYYSRFFSENGIFFGSHIGNLDDLKLRFELGQPTEFQPYSSKIKNPKQEVLHHLFKLKSFFSSPKNKFELQYAFQKDNRKEFSVRRLNNAPALDMDLQTHIFEGNWKNFSLENWKTELGISYLHQENYNQPGTGITPVIPNFASGSAGVYAIEKYVKYPWQAEIGLRYDYKNIHADGYNANGERYGKSNDFQNVTYSLSAHWFANDAWSFSSDLGLAWRAPHVSELYSNGLHHGAGIFQVGDENLHSEKGLKWVASVAFSSEKISVTAEGFLQRISGYIYDFPTGETRSLFSGVYPVFAYAQSDAFFRGGDLEVIFPIVKPLKYSAKASVVYANDMASGRYFPYISPLRFSEQLQWSWQNRQGQFHHWEATLKHSFVAKQHRFDPEKELVNSTPAPYHLLAAELGTHLRVKKINLKFYFSVENLTNQLYKDYTNRFRYYAHDMGRNYKFNIIINI